MKKIFIGNLILLVVLNLLVKPVWIFGIDLGVQNLTGSEEYGFYFALFNFSLIFNIFLDVGITNFNNRNIAQSPQLAGKHFARLSVLKLGLGVLYLIVAFTIAALIGYSRRQFSMLLFLTINQFLLSFILYLRSNISALHFFRIDSLISVLDRGLLILICGWLLLGPASDSFRIEWFVYAQTLAYALTAITAFGVVMNKTGSFRPRFHLAFSISVLKKSAPFALLVLLMAIYNRIDSVFLERLLPDGAYQAGIYAQSFRILDAANNYAFLFAALLLPMFARMLKQGEPIEGLLKTAITLLMLPAFWLVVCCIVFGRELLALLYDSPGTDTGVFPILIGCFIGTSGTYIAGTLLTANGNLRQLNITALAGLMLNIGLNLILIPLLKARGAAISGLVTQIVMAAVQFILVVRTFSLSLNKRFLLQIAAFCGTLVVAALAVKQFELSLFTGISLLALVGGILVPSLRIITLAQIKKLLPQSKPIADE